MTRLALLMLVVSAGLALAQQDSPEVAQARERVVMLDRRVNDLCTAED